MIIRFSLRPCAHFLSLSLVPGATSSAFSSEVRELSPVTNRILMLDGGVTQPTLSKDRLAGRINAHRLIFPQPKYQLVI